jgi:hypothetical protein
MNPPQRSLQLRMRLALRASVRHPSRSVLRLLPLPPPLAVSVSVLLPPLPPLLFLLLLRLLSHLVRRANRTSPPIRRVQPRGLLKLWRRLRSHVCTPFQPTIGPATHAMQSTNPAPSNVQTAKSFGQIRMKSS